MLPSPYSPGATPTYLAGRGQQLDLIATRLSRMRMLGRSGGPLLAFHAPRGLGKTSLLRQAQRDANAAGYVTVWITGRDDADLGPDLTRQLTGAVERGGFRDRAGQLLDHLDQVQVEVGVPGAKVSTTADTRRTSDDLESLLADTGRLARKNDRHGLVVFVDELQEVRLADRRSVLIALQHFDGEPGGCPVTVVAAGLPSVLSAVPEAATFGERSDFVEIGRLEPVAIAEALRLPAQSLDVRWSDEAVLAAISASGNGYPHQVQLLGDETWSAARPTAGDELSAGHVTAAIDRISARMTGLYRSRLAKITDEQRRVVVAMTQLSGDHAPGGEQAVSRAALAAHLGIRSESLSRVRQELLDSGLIEPAGRGHLRFTLPGFADHVRGTG